MFDYFDQAQRSSAVLASDGAGFAAAGGPLMRGAITRCQIARGVDQCEMREGLRKVAKLPLGGWIVFFGKQPDIIAQRQQSAKQFARVFFPPLQDIVVRKPETASQERAFAGRKPVGSRAGVIPQHKAVSNKIALDCLQRAAHARIRSRKETHHRNQQQTGVKRGNAIGLHERVLFMINPLSQTCA